MTTVITLLTLIPVLAVLVFPFVFRSSAGASAHRWKALGLGILTVLVGTFLITILSGYLTHVLMGGNTAETAIEVENAGWGSFLALIFGFFGGMWLSSFLALWLEWRILKG